MRILFVVNRLAHVRHFDRAIRLLADRGHDVCLASQDDDMELWGCWRSSRDIPRSWRRRNRGDDWARPRPWCVARVITSGISIPDTLGESAAGSAPSRRWSGRSPDSAEKTRTGVEPSCYVAMPKTDQRRLDVLLAKLETAIPSDPDIDEFLTRRSVRTCWCCRRWSASASHRPTSSRARGGSGIPSGMLVFSWDNLSNKGLHSRDAGSRVGVERHAACARP